MAAPPTTFPDVGSPSPRILAGTLVPTVLSSIFAIARFWARGYVTKNWGVDDTLIFIAWIFSLALAVSNCIFTEFGAGQLINPFAMDLHAILSLGLACQLIYQLTLCVTKLGLCVFYLRVFQDKAGKYFVYALLGFISISFIVIECLTMFRCKKISDVWSPKGIMSGSCRSGTPILIGSAVCNIISDIALMAFVIPRIASLKIRRRQKFSVLAIVSLGFLVIAASIVRVVRAQEVFNSPKEKSWDGYDLTTWSTVEVTTGIFCASAPCIKPLIKKYAPGFMSTRGTSNITYGETNGAPKTYGTGAGTNAQSGRSARNSFELQSCSEDFTQKSTASAGGQNESEYWSGTGNRPQGQEKEFYDDDSQIAVLPPADQQNIEKSFSHRVSGEPDEDEGRFINQDRNHRGFEHV